MGTAPHPTARGLLVWMQTNPERLRALLDAEAGGSDDLSPAGDPAVRAHLRFVAEALAAHAAPAAAPALEVFAATLPAEFAAREHRLADELARIAEATALELDLQFGDEVADDPGIRAMIDRRMRIAAWTRVFLDALDDARPGRPPVREGALAWMGERQTQLADTIFAMDRRAKEAEMARGGPDAVANPEVVNRIGQAAMLQAHTRFLVEALAERI
ncbi:MAG: hypothetical protein JHC74_00650 [Thermoleophilia bacterium]|nr:hypothetical protein [Thermoleophilia bacterium]